MVSIAEYMMASLETTITTKDRTHGATGSSKTTISFGDSSDKHSETGMTVGEDTHGGNNPIDKSTEPGQSNPSTANPIMDWDGPNDGKNPRNWSLRKKAYAASVPGLISLVITFASSVYSSGVADVMRDFGVSETAAFVPLSVYMWGIALGPVIGAPISETYGRRVVYMTTLPLSLLFTLGAGFAQNFGTLVICRFLAAMFGSPALAVGAGTNLDIWAPINRGLSVGLFMVAPFIGPALGPAVGGFTAEFKGWRWTQWIILFFGVPVWIYTLLQPETYGKVLLREKAKRAGIQLPKIPLWSVIKTTTTITLFRPIHMLFTEPIVIIYSFYISFNFSVLFCFFAAFPLVFQGVYEFSDGLAGIVFCGLAVGIIIAAVIYVLSDRFLYVRRVKQLAKSETSELSIAPEHRLYPAMFGSVMLPIALFWFGWTARSDIHWISPVIATVPFACGNLLVFCAAALYLTDIYGPMNGASALAATGASRYLLGGAFPLFTVQMYDKLGIGWATSLLGFIAVALMPSPWILFRYGHIIRRRSKYAVPST